MSSCNLPIYVTQQFYTCAQKGVVLNDDTELELNLSSIQIAFMNKVADQLRSSRFEENSEDSNDLEDIVSCKFYNIDDFKKEKFSKLYTISVLHLDVHSIERHIDEIQVFLSLLDFDFDVLCFSGPRL